METESQIKLQDALPRSQENTAGSSNTRLCDRCKNPIGAEREKETSNFGGRKYYKYNHCVECYQQLEFESEWDDAKLENEKRNQEFENTDYHLGGTRARKQFTRESFVVNDRNKNAFEACSKFNPKTDNLYLFGETGTGKSHLSIIAARRFGSKVRTVKPCDIFRAIRSCDGAAEETEVIESYAGVVVLVIDDLGVGKDTEFAVTSMYEIIDRRYQSMRGGLIVTTNLSPDDLAKKFGDDRITSRLAQMCKGHIFSLSGEDWRLK